MLKASLEYVQSPDNHAFLLRNFGVEAFEAPYHFHPEYELTYITQGTGRRYVGSHMENFAPGDLVLIAPNVPHCWKLEISAGEQIAAEAVVIQFSPEMLGDKLLEKKEMTAIRRLLKSARVGTTFNESVAERLGETLRALSDKAGFYGFIEFLRILQHLAEGAENGMCTVFDQDNAITITLAEQQRMAPVFAYLVEHFRNRVSLREVAAIAHMTPQAFCKYFKKITRKTFMDTVMEYRLNYATQQLAQTDKPVSDIAFESGFADVSFFYRTFKKKTKLSPLNYRRQFITQV